MSDSSDQFTSTGFIKTYFIPVLLIFLVPGVSLWFFNHVQSDYDAKLLARIESGIQNSPELSEEQRAEAIAYYRRVPMSRILSTDKAGNTNLIRSTSDDIKRDYFVFRWMIRIAQFCLISGIVVFLVAGISVVFSLRSQLAQYWSLLVGWHVLRIFAFLQVLGQGSLAVALSFWITAFYTNKYSVRLVGAIGIMAVIAMVLIIKAIFKRLNEEFVVEGEVLREGIDPLRRELDAMGAKLGTEPPQHIIAGIDDNFFVTEHPVTVRNERLEGRTLFVSLSLLRSLSRSEASAVLAHEMAHFSGSDTLYSKKISPLLGRYHAYLEALHEGVLSRPIFFFMLFFWSLYQLSLQRISRQREFRADDIAASLTSPDDIAGSLIKIAAYSRYRHQVERELFEKEQIHEAVNISDRVATGFPQFVTSCVSRENLADSETAHPFDSHPPMGQRIKAVGREVSLALQEEVLLRPVTDSWYVDIGNAAQTENAQWAEYEQQFKTLHENNLAYRYMPGTPEEESIVLKYFPGLQIKNKKENLLTLDYRHLHFSKWPEPIRFDEITECSSDESLGKHYFTIKFKRDGRSLKEKFCISGFEIAPQEVFQAIDYYYTRHLASREYQKIKQNPDPETA